MIDRPCPQGGSATTNQIMGGNQTDQWELREGRAAEETNQSGVSWAGPNGRRDVARVRRRLRRAGKWRRRRRRAAAAAAMEPGYGGKCRAGRPRGAAAHPGWRWLLPVAASAPAPLPASAGGGERTPPQREAERPPLREAVTPLIG